MTDAGSSGRFQTVSGRKSAEARMSCSKPGGCSGSCPLSVLTRNHVRGVPTTYTVWRYPWPIPWSSAACLRAAADSKFLDEIASLRSTVKKLKASVAAASAGDGAAMELDEGAVDGSKDMIKSLCAPFKFLQGVEQHDRAIFDLPGDYDKLVADTEQQLQETTAIQCGVKLFDEQKASAGHQST